MGMRLFRGQPCRTRRTRSPGPMSGLVDQPRMSVVLTALDVLRRHNVLVHITAKADYAVRAVLALATKDDGRPVKSQELAQAEGISVKFLESILMELRRAGIVASQRGAEGGYRLARPADRVSVAEIMRAVGGPLAEVHGLRPEAARYDGASRHLQEVWIAVRANVRAVLEAVTLADLASGELPHSVRELTADPDAWEPH